MSNIASIDFMLAQLATVKARLPGLDDTVDDTLLTNAIKGASQRFARHCNRIFDRTVGAAVEFQADYCEITAIR